MKSTLRLCLFLGFGVITILGHSQPVPVNCDMMNPLANDVLPGCALCDTFYMGSTDDYTPGPIPPNFCGQIENNQWFQFMPSGQGPVTFTITPSGCDNGDGVQAAVYNLALNQRFGCASFGNNNPNPINFTLNNLNTCQRYYLMIDGWAGDECDFTIIANGILAGEYVEITPIAPICEKDTVIQLIAFPTAANCGTGTWSGDVSSTGTFNPANLGPGTYTATYSFESNLECEAEDEITFTILPAPDVEIDDAGPFCVTDPPVTLTATPAGGIWSGSVQPNGQFNPSIGPGTYNIYYRYTNSDGCTGRDTLEITVNPLPVVEIDPIPNACVEDDPFTITADPPGGTFTGVTTTGDVDPGALGPGTYTVTYTYTDADGCTNSDNASFTIFANPVVNITQVGPYCENDPTVNLSGTPSGGTWGGAAGSNGTFNPGANGPGTHTVTYTYTNANGCEGEDEIDIVVNENPDVSIDDPGEFCNTDPPTTLTADPPGGTWGGSAGPNGSFNPGALGPGTHTVTYSFTNSDGCAGNDQISITVNQGPNVNITPPGPICANDDPFDLTASPNGGDWSGDVDPSGTVDPADLGPGTFTAIYEYTDSKGCSDADTIMFTINPAPTVNLDDAGPFCENDPPVTLNGTPAGGSWSGPVSPAGVFNPGAAGPGSHTITYTYTNSFGCTEETEITIDVNELPEPEVIDPGPVCVTDPPFTLDGDPPGGNWGGVAGSNGEIDPGALGVGTHVVTYSYTDPAGCSGNTTFNLVISPLPNVNIIPPGPICEDDDPVDLTGTPPGGDWYGDVDAGGTIDPSALGPGTWTAIYEYFDGNGCGNADTITFVINPTPDVSIDPAGPFCENDPQVTLSATPAGGTWAGPVSPTGVFNPMNAGPGTHTITYTVTDPNGCVGEEEIDIEVIELPEPEIFDPGPICQGDPAFTLDADPSGGVWGGVAGPNGEIDPGVLGPGTYVITYSYTDPDGCTGNTTFNLTINPPPVVNILPVNPLCENGNPVNLVGTPPGGDWFGDVDGGGTIDPADLGPGTFMATYEYTNSNGCLGTAEITFIINPAPVVDIDPVDPMCENAPPVTLVPSPAGGTWSGPVSGMGVFNPQAVGPGLYTASYSFTNSFGCTETADVDLEVIELPEILFLSPNQYCADEDPILLDVDPLGGTWGGAASVDGEIDPSVLGPGSHIVTYFYEDPFGCSQTDSMTINIRPTPVVTINPAGPFCENAPRQTLIATPPGGFWDGEAGPNGRFEPQQTGPGIWEVIYEYTDNFGCTGIATREIEVIEIPVIDIDPVDPVCEDAGIQQLVADPPGGTWGPVANPAGQYNPAVLFPGFHTASYTFTGPNGCTNTEEVDIEVIGLPQIDFIFTGPYCLVDEFLTLEVYPFGGDWTGDVNAFGEFNPVDLGPGTYSATYTYEDGFGCVNSATTPFTILAPVDIFFIGDSTFCASQGPITLRATPGGANGRWSGSIVTQNGQINPSSLSPGTYQVTYTYTDLGGCEFSKNLNVRIIGPPTMAISGNFIHCQTTGTVTFTGTPSGGTWSGVANPSGQINTNNLTVGTHTVTYTVTYANGCTAALDQTITITAPPTASIAGDGTICPGGTEQTPLIINFSGAGPWTVGYSIDNVSQVPITTSSNPYTLMADQPGTYTLTTVADNAGCNNNGTGSATVTQLVPLAITGIDSDCDGTNTNFTIEFEISGGDPGSYLVTGLTGTVSAGPPYIYTSNPIPSGTDVSFTVQDNSGCAPISDNLLVDCACETEVGTMNTSIIRNCGPATVTAVYDSLNQYLDADDLLQFVLHTNSGVSLGTVLATGNAPTFSFNPANMNFGTTYYISAVAGSNDGTGNINLMDNCLQVAAGTPIVFYRIPDASLTGDAILCTGESATLTVQLTGQQPWSLSYFNGTDTVRLNGISSNPYTFTITPSQTTTYQLLSVNNAFCTGNAIGIATVTVNDSPEVVDVVTDCDDTYTNYTVTITIAGGDPDSYLVSGLTGTLNGNVFSSNPIPSGTGFSATISDGNGCPPDSIRNPLVDCGCLTTVGDMSNSTLRICGDGPAVAVYDSTLQMLDADDIVRFVLHTNPGNILGTILGVNTLPEFIFNPATMTYGTTYYISAVAASNDGTGNINFADNCLDVTAGTPVIFRRLPTAFLSADAIICRGDTAFLQVDFTGTGPWVLTYNNGSVDRNITATTSPYLIPVMPTQTTNYSLVSIRDANCVGDVSGTGRVIVNQAPQVRNIVVECNSDKTEYTVTFEIFNGDPSTYQVTGGPGTLIGNIFTSDPIPANLGYNFLVFDGNGCGQVPLVEPTVVCECETEVGTLDRNPLVLCINESASGIYNGGEFLDANDTLLFVLHDGTGTTLGNILMVNRVPDFSFDPDILTIGVRYFIAAVAGNRNNATGISFSDPCLKVSAGVAVTWYALPTALLSGGTTICEGDQASINLQLTGVPPFNVVLFDGNNSISLNGISSSYQYNFSPLQTTTISIISVEGTYCENTSSSTATVVVNKPPFAQVTTRTEVCNTNQNGDPTSIDFSSLVLGGDRNGIWTDLDGSGASGSFPILDFSGITPGTYRFTYQTNSAQAPCTDQTYNVAIVVRDCSCPSVATTAPAPLCNDDALLDLRTITTTSEPGTWTIISAPAGNNPATIASNIFNANGRDAGDYVIQFTLTATPPAGCPRSSTQTVRVSQAVSAGTSPGTVSYCSDAVATVRLFDLLQGATPGGSWTNTSNNAGSQFDPNSSNLSVAGLAAGSYTFEYLVNGLAPCPDDAVTIIVVVQNPVTAGTATGFPALCQGTDSLINLADLLVGNDPGGIWTEISSVPSAGGAFNATSATFNTANQRPGVYEFRYSLTAQAPCTNDAAVVSVTINTNPVAAAGTDMSLTCDTRRATIGSSNSSSGPNISYFWTGPLVSNPNVLIQDVNGPGTYILTVTNTLTGCFATDEVLVDQDQDLPTLSANSVEITCFDDNNGIIQVQNVSGGLAPYMFSLNDGPFTNASIFTNLAPGTYTLAVEDANGCQDRLNFTIAQPDELTVTLSVDLDNQSNVIRQGDSVLLVANVNGPFDSVYWTPADAFIPCDPEAGLDDCLKQWVSPTSVTTYAVYVVNEKGCLAGDEITLRVKKSRNVYIPTGFSPNGDNVNDGFRIYGDDQLEQVKSFLVFDRWGNLVYEYYNFVPDDPAGSWDGTFKGQKMDPAVFAYFAEIEFKDGEVVLYKGDVTLVK